MKLDTFFDNFGLLADAPNGVQKLREMVLQLAVQGKLVPQDSKDKPASVLLEKIKAEKERLIKENKIKKPKPLPLIEADEIPFELPFNWVWARLDTICSYIQRGKGPKYIDDSNIPVISQKCIQWDGFKIERARFVDPSSIEKYAEERFLQTGDLLWNSTGTGTIGRVNVYSHEENHYDLVVADSHVTVVRSIKINPRYSYIFLASPVVQFGFEERASGTTNQIELNTATVKNQIIAVPPVPEQKRIVSKVDELMVLCDELEVRKQKVNKNCIQLNDASIYKLLTAREPTKFSKHWQRICDNFDLLYSKPKNVTKLRQAILQLAVQGNLVPQDPKDEPASVLLEKIKGEKERLIKEGKIKKAKPLPPIRSGEIPYEIPNGWEWIRLGEMGFTQTGTTPSKSNPAYFGKYIPFIKPADIFKNSVNYENEGLAKQGLKHGRLIESNSILMVCIGGSIGKVNFIERACSCNQQINTITLYASILYNLINYFMRSPYFQNEVVSRAPKTTLPIISKGKWALIPTPLPPANEQKQIVEKVDGLMALCDELETSLSKSQTDCDRLMEAVAADILAA